MTDRSNEKVASSAVWPLNRALSERGPGNSLDLTLHLSPAVAQSRSTESTAWETDPPSLSRSNPRLHYKRNLPLIKLVKNEIGFQPCLPVRSIRLFGSNSFFCNETAIIGLKFLRGNQLLQMLPNETLHVIIFHVNCPIELQRVDHKSQVIFAANRHLAASDLKLNLELFGGRFNQKTFFTFCALFAFSNLLFS